MEGEGNWMGMRGVAENDGLDSEVSWAGEGGIGGGRGVWFGDRCVLPRGV